MTNTSILFTDSFSVTLPAAYKVETCGVTTISLALLNYNISEPRNRQPTPNFLLSVISRSLSFIRSNVSLTYLTYFRGVGFLLFFQRYRTLVISVSRLFIIKSIGLRLRSSPPFLIRSLFSSNIGFRREDISNVSSM